MIGNSVLAFVLTGIGGLFILIACEYFIRRNKLKGEKARKLVHITIAVYASTWAFYLNNQLIILISLILIASVVIAQKKRILKSMKSVGRVTYGEVWYPIGIGVSALLFHNPYVYMLAILHMGLADGLAAVVGKSMGKNARRYKIAGTTKSIAGSLVFFATSFIVYFGYWEIFADQSALYASAMLVFVVSLSSALLVTITEVIAPKGSDNIIVPVIAGTLAILPSLQIIV